MTTDLITQTKEMLAKFENRKPTREEFVELLDQTLELAVDLNRQIKAMGDFLENNATPVDGSNKTA